jgi:glutamate 5-kinase
MAKMTSNNLRDTREEVLKAKRVVLKVGSSSLTGSAGAGLDLPAVDKLVDAVAILRKRGVEVLVVSSGAIAAGLSPLGLTTRPKDLATQQAAASVGQGLLIYRYTESFARHGITASQVLITSDDVIRRSHYRNAQRTFDRLLALGVVPVINENDTVGTQEIRFGDNDRLAALVSHLVQADLLILLSDIDALYDAPPTSANAKQITDVKDFALLDETQIGGAGTSGVGSGGMVTKVEAARIATGAGIPVILTSLANAEAAVMGAEIGTLFHANGVRTSSRALWLAHASLPKGKLHLDAGATTAIRERGTSLLPAGVTKVEGDFAAGDPVDLISPQGEVIARGLVAFDADEIPQLLGKSTKELGASLGAEYERELVHRDDLSLL